MHCCGLVADVKAFYPSLYREIVTKALECAMEKLSSSTPRPTNHC